MSLSTCVLANNSHPRQVWSISSIALAQEKPDSYVSCIVFLKKNQKSEFQFGKREDKVDIKEVNGRKHLIDQPGSERQNVLWLSEILEFGEHPQRGFRVCVLEQEMGQRYMDTRRIRVSYETVDIPGRGDGLKQRRGLQNLKCLHWYKGAGSFCGGVVASWIPSIVRTSFIVLYVPRNHAQSFTYHCLTSIFSFYPEMCTLVLWATGHFRHQTL